MKADSNPPSGTARSAILSRFDSPRLRAEIVAAGWELFSSLLFVSAVVPAAWTTPWPGTLFLGSIALSALLSRTLLARGVRGFALAAAIRMVAWPLAIVPLLEVTGARGLVAALAFGLMAGGMRRAIYRRFVDRLEGDIDHTELRTSLRARLAESAMMAGIAGGHIMLLFSVAFLRTQSQVIFRAWFEIVPVLALFGTIGFTLAVRPASSDILAALEAGPEGDPEILRRGLVQTAKLPSFLSYLNFAVWSSSSLIGILTIHREGLAAGSFGFGDSIMQLAFGSLFAWAVAFYQRSLHRDIVAAADEKLREWLGLRPGAEPITLRRRMLRDFGIPLLFTGTLSLFSSIGLYRALGSNLSIREDFNAITALFASFAMLVIAALGIVFRAARDLSKPMTELARAADRVAHGKLDAAVPPVAGPVEVVGLGESVERMREALAQTIAALETERAGLERNVEIRTAELRRALEELKRTQAALIQGERLATIGELVSGVAHEINNPLNAIAGASVPLESLVEDLRKVMDAYRAAEIDLKPERRRAMEKLRAEQDLDASLDDLVGISSVIKRATARSVRIVNNLRNFARGGGEAVPTDLHACLEETLMLIAPRLRQACVRVDKAFGDIPLITCRAGEINQVFMNLLVNAIQALEQRSGEKAEPELRIETKVDGDAVAVTITDNGPGVPGDIQPRIFDPFFTTKPRGQGTGLGLSISSDIARRHGGSLSLETPEGGGARFICRLPLRRGKAQSVRSTRR